MLLKRQDKSFEIFIFFSLLFRIIIFISNYGYESITELSDNSFIIIDGDQENFIREAEIISNYISTADWNINPINHIFNMQGRIGTLLIGWPLILAIYNASNYIYLFLDLSDALIFFLKTY